MHEDVQEAITSARDRLRQNDTLVLGEHWYGVRTLLDVAAWRTRDKAQRTYDIFGEDDCGNEYLKARDGEVFFWDHETEDIRLLAESIPAFLSALRPQPEVKLKPAQVKKVWIDPAFLEQQRRLGNTKD